MDSPHLNHECFLAQRRFGSLDGLRCLSILAVIWHHAGFPIAGTLLDEQGFLGVDMFFVLSGFLIVTLLLRERDRRGQFSRKNFYIRRTLRIFPLYYGLILAITLVLLFVKPHANMAEPWFRELPILLTYTANWFEITTFMAIAWSLGAEEQFYLLWPQIEYYLAKYLMWILGILIVLTQVIQFGLADGLLEYLGAGQDEPSMLRETTFMPILLGVLLAHLLHDPRGYKIFSLVAGHRWSPLAYCLGLLAVFMVAPLEDIRGWARPAIHILMFLLLASCVVREDHILSRFLEWKPIVRLGVISYGMYLLHMVARHGADVLLEMSGISFRGDMFLLCLMLTVVLAELSYRLYESPFLKLKRLFS